MSQKLISRSPDLKRLRDEGYEITLESGFLIIHHIPYVNSSRNICYGTLACQLNLISNEMTARPSSHVIYFQGEHPCDKNGNIIHPISHTSQRRFLFNNFAVDHTFSNKPLNGYENYFELVTRYIEIISAPAISMDFTVSAKNFNIIVDEETESIFEYIDSNSSRANINVISDKLINEKVGIVGLGGTGAYLLDFISKTPVKEIRIFDGDSFLQHNAFRSPGAATKDDLNQHLSKIEYYRHIYSRMHRNIQAHKQFITEENMELLDGLTFVFISIDRGSVKKILIKYLLDKGINFIDVGMGILQVDDSLIGSIRITTATNNKNDHLPRRISFFDDEANEYNTNIQIAELNALNASLAVIKWKKLCGFYNDLENEFNTTYSINVSQLLNDEIAT